MQVLIEIARRLDIHPADLVPELEPLLSHRRQDPGDADAVAWARTASALRPQTPRKPRTLPARTPADLPTLSPAARRGGWQVGGHRPEFL